MARATWAENGTNMTADELAAWVAAARTGILAGWITLPVEDYHARLKLAADQMRHVRVLTAPPADGSDAMHYFEPAVYTRETWEVDSLHWSEAGR